MKAWVTLLTQPDYLPGVEALHRSLRGSDTDYPLVVMITENIEPAICARLRAEGCQIRLVPPLYPRKELTTYYASAQFSEVWTKLRAWQLIEFTRVVFLDADMLIVKNMDELFDIALPESGIAACHACRCNPNNITRYPQSWVPDNCAYSWQERGEPVPADQDAYFNAGFLVLTPDNGLFNALAQHIARIEDLSAYPFSEQDLLNAFFADRWKTLPYIYNALKTLSVQHPAIWNRDEVKNIHYILAKPWSRDWQQPEDPRDRYYALDKLWLNFFGQAAVATK